MLRNRTAGRPPRERLLVALHRTGDIALCEPHVAETQERAADHVRRRARGGGATEPGFRIDGVSLFERDLSLDEGAQAQPFPRPLDDHRRPLAPDDALEDAHRRTTVPD